MHRSVVLLVVLWPGIALAQDPAAAQALFDEGKKLVEKGDFVAACPKFQASLELDIKLGTKLALAACFERIGKNASAWVVFRDAAAMANRAGQGEAAREAYALKHARDLESKLTRLVVVAPEPVPGLVVSRDKQVMPPTTLGIAVPIDPGEHMVSAAANGYEAWSQRLLIRDEPVTTVKVPALKKVSEEPAPPVARPEPTPPPVPVARPEPPAPAPVPVPVAPEEPRPSTPTLRWVGYGVGGAGVVLVGVGVVFGLSASSKWSDAKDMCTGSSEPLQCTPQGVKLRDDAAGAATISTVTMVAGAVAIAGGVTAILLSRRPSRAQVGLAPTPGGVSFVVAGGF